MLWVEKQHTYTDTEHTVINTIIEKYKLNPFIAGLVAERNEFSLEKIDYFLSDTFKPISPMTLKDMKEATDIIMHHMSLGHKIRVESDFDCDGLFSTYILKQTFDALNYPQFDYHIPHREKDGYGLSIKAVEKAFEDGVKLIITVDNGISAVDAVARANELGIEVVVTDHHTPPDVLPPAVAIVNPHQKDCPYTQKMLSGGMVAYKLSQALIMHTTKELRAHFVQNGYKEKVISAAAMSAIADVMDILGENRAIVKEGFKYLGQGAIPSVQAIMPTPSIYGVSFVVAPRFNSMGRLDDMSKSLDYLLETNPIEILNKKEVLEKYNDMRRDEEKQALARVMEKISTYNTLPPIIIEIAEDTHESVVGLVAGRVKEALYRPTIIFSKTINGEYKGSGRSIEEYNMIAEISPYLDLLSGGGGHPMACGLKAENLEQIEAFRNALLNACTLTETDLEPKIKIDQVISIDDDLLHLYHSSKRLEPFAVGNPAPLFAMKNVYLAFDYKTYKNGEFAKITISDEVDSLYTIDAICWDSNIFLNNGIKSTVATLADICFNIGMNDYTKHIQLTIKAIHFK